MTADPIQVCFVALHAFPAIDPSVGGFAGGTEARAWMLARTLAQRDDMRLTFVIRHAFMPRRLDYDNVRLAPMIDRLCRIREAVGHSASRQAQFPWIRVHRWRPGLFWRLAVLAACRPFDNRRSDPRTGNEFFARMPADVFCTFGVGENSAAVIASAKQSGRPSVLFLGANSDLDERYSANSDFLTPYGERGSVCHFTLTAADVIVAQTAWPQQTLRERFGRDSVVIENPIDLQQWRPAGDAADEPRYDGAPQQYVLWVGRSDAFHKRPLLCLELARQCPDIRFLMVMNPRTPEIDQQVRRERPANVTILERVPFSEMPAVVRGAAVFVSTSSRDYEGFPNLFLQAAASGVPLASLEVGREFIDESGGGIEAGGDLQKLASGLRELYVDAPRAQECGARAQQYVAQHHALSNKVEQLAEVLKSAATNATIDERPQTKD